MLYLLLRSIAFKGKLCPTVLLKSCHNVHVFMNDLLSRYFASMSPLPNS